jgi:glycosyltransferase involved in cell wall biosynthesis
VAVNDVAISHWGWAPPPLLKDLPETGKSGWPWTAEAPQIPPLRPDGSPWPRISIVTPSYNQGTFIEETIRSVLLQGYPNLEYIIIDGGSSDQSVEIIKKYEPWLAYWVSEGDKGQSHAINKGLARATGDLFNWINSDDMLLPGALAAIGGVSRPGAAIAGAVLNFGICATRIIENKRLSLTRLLDGDIDAGYHQPGLWLRPARIASVGGIDETLHYTFDYDITLRYLAKYPDVIHLPQTVASFRLHERSKSSSQPDDFESERIIVYEKILNHPDCAALKRICSLHLRNHAWWEKLDVIERSNGSAVFRAVMIVLAMWADPSVRMSRLSLGAVRRVLFS